MELKLCVVLAVAGCALATPYGYHSGVKGSAAAKADSSAAAGAFSGAGGMPAGVSVTGGYSGSFSKSSASSFASSSASSSSSSFTFSGSGLPCSNGICHNSGTNNGNHNSDSYSNNPNNGYSEAAAAGQASAVAGAASKVSSLCSGGICPQNEDCTGPSCNNMKLSHKCESGQCIPPTTTLDSQSGSQSNKNCNSGVCTSPLHPDTKPYNSLSNADSDNSKKNCQSGQCNSGSLPETPSFNNNSPKCIAGQCAPSTPSQSGYNSNYSPNKPDAEEPSVPNYKNPNKCSSGLCESLPNYEKGPKNHDIFVNIENKVNPKTNTNSKNPNYDNLADCPYGNCGDNPTKTSDIEDEKKHTFDIASMGTFISAYNKPAIYLTAPKQDTPCNSPNCKPFLPDDQPIYTGSHHVPQIAFSNSYNSDCVGGKCSTNKQNTPISNYFSTPPLKYPNYADTDHKCTSTNCQNPLTPHTHQPDNGTPNCSGGKCIPKAPSNSYNKPSYINPESTGLNRPFTSSAGHHLDVPSTVLNYPTNPIPVESEYKSPNGKEDYPYLLPSTPCSGYNCGGAQSQKPGLPGFARPSHVQPNTISLPENTPVHRPVTSNEPSDSNPEKPYTGGFGGPPGFLKPNDFNLPSNLPVQTSKPTGSVQSPPPCSTSDCKHPLPSNNNQQTGVNHPGSSNTSPCAFGNCASTSLNSETTVPNTANPLPSKNYGQVLNTLGPHYKPSCALGNCASPNGETTVPSATLPSHKHNDVNPSGLYNTPPCTSGNCGFRHANSGTTAPNNVYPPSQSPTINSGTTAPNKAYPNEQFLGPHTTPLCPSGNCPKVNDGTTIPISYSYGHGVNPSGSYNTPPCKSGNCGVPNSNSGNTSPNTAHSPGQIAANPSGLYKAPSCASENCASTNINDRNTIPNIAQPHRQPVVNPSVPYNTAPCTSGNCGVPQSNSGAVAPNAAHFPGQIGAYSSGSYKAPTCASGNCASTNVNDRNTIPNIAQPHRQPVVNPSVPYNTAPCTSGNCGVPQSNSGATSPNTAHSSSQIGAYSSGSYKAPTCASGNCASTNLITNNAHLHGQAGVNPSEPHNTQPCASGNCALPNVNGGTTINSDVHATAAASANAVAYTGGFGGPPGFLKPFDDGKVGKSIPLSSDSKYSPNSEQKTNTQPEYESGYNKESSSSGVGAFAAAKANAGAVNRYSHNIHDLSGPNGSNEGGCGSGCATNDGKQHSGYNNGASSLGLTHAKAGAVSEAGAGFSGSFASSSAGSYASSASRIKGYGRR